MSTVDRMNERGPWRPSGRKMRSRCRRIVSDLRLPHPFSASRLVAAISAQRGRPLELIALPSLERLPCGLLIATDHTDYIGYPASTPLHQLHIVLHEIGHLLCGHLDGTGLNPTATAALTPHLSPELVRKVLGRDRYADEQEQEAELLASLIGLRVTTLGEDAARASTERAPGLAALAALMGPRHTSGPA